MLSSKTFLCNAPVFQLALFRKKLIKLTSCALQVFLKNPSEVKAVDCKGDGLWEEAWTFKNGPREKSPVMKSFFSYDPKNND
jgi:hypothetical protein